MTNVTPLADWELERVKRAFASDPLEWPLIGSEVHIAKRLLATIESLESKLAEVRAHATHNLGDTSPSYVQACRDILRISDPQPTSEE